MMVTKHIVDKVIARDGDYFDGDSQVGVTVREGERSHTYDISFFDVGRQSWRDLHNAGWTRVAAALRDRK